MGTRGPKSKSERDTPEPRRLATVSQIRSATMFDPPRALATHGKSLWDRIVAEYDVDSSAAVELLCQACQALDRAEDCAGEIARNGLMVGGREHPLVKHELAARAFCAKIVQRLELEL